MLYPYLLGHSFFNIKDIPFLSIWLICTYYIILLFKFFIHKRKILNSHLIILSILTAYLLSIRISGILIFIQYLIFFLLSVNISNFGFLNFLKKFYKKIICFFSITFALFYLLHPGYWQNPLIVFEAINYMSNHVQTVCTVTLGNCMSAQNFPSTYLPLWLLFKLPIIVLFGLMILPFTEKKIFLNKENILIVGSLLLSITTIIILLILFNVNLYDELRQVMFIVPLIFIISLSSIYFFSKKLSFCLILIYICFFTFQNIKIYPYNYVWLNNLTIITKVNKIFELDYWGVSSKELAKYFNSMNIDKGNCIISNRNNGIAPFMKNKETCFLPFSDLHSNNQRPFYVAFMERSLGKGTPNNCKNIYNETIKINFSKEDIILAKVFRCN